MKSPISLLLIATLCIATPMAGADVLLIDAIAETPANSSEGLLRPQRGQNMNTVRARFGEPDEQIPWIGEPPISRWVYEDFTVYFEHEYVINSVVHR